MAVACDPTSLLAAAKCFQCLTPKQLDAVTTYLLAVAAGGSTDPATLLNQAKCFLSCYTPAERDAVQTYLLCKINGG